MKEEISKEDLLLMVKQLDLSLDARMNRIMGKRISAEARRRFCAIFCGIIRREAVSGSSAGNCTVCRQNCFGVSGKRGRHNVFGAEDRLRQFYQ